MNNKNYTVPYRRKRNGLTNYKKRLKLLKSDKPRLVIRRFLNSILVQVIEYDPKGDKVMVSANSRELEKLGWKLHKGNLPSAYLTGLLAGMKAKKSSIKEAVPDIGFSKPVKGSAVYAAIAGAVDAGLNVPHSKEVLPSKDRISGKHIADYAKASGKDTSKGIATEKIPSHFEEIKTKVLKNV